jgi:hypothetical protein
MGLQDIDKLILEIGMLVDQYNSRLATLREIRNTGGIKRHDIDMLTLMAESFKLEGIGLRETITTCTIEFMNNRR